MDKNCGKKTGFEPVKPPKNRRMPGRPKVVRRRDPFEEPKSSHKLSKKNIRMKCSKCKRYGHNCRTCKDPTQANDGAQNIDSTPTVTTRAPKLQVRRNGPTLETTKSTTSSSKGKERVPNGFGVFISPHTGNTFVCVSDNSIFVGFS